MSGNKLHITIEKFESEILPDGVKINQIGDSTWYIDNKGKNVYPFDWNAYFILPDNFNLLIQELALDYAGGHKNSSNGRIITDIKMFKGFVRHTFELFSACHKHYPNKALRQFKLDEVVTILQDILSVELKNNNQGYGKIRDIIVILRLLEKHYRTLSDGLLINLPKHFIDFSCKEFLIQKGIDYAQWKKGGTHGAIPLHIAIPLLDYCIKWIESDTVKHLQTHYKLAEEHSILNPNKIRKNILKFNNYINDKEFYNESNKALTPLGKQFKIKLDRLSKALEEELGHKVKKYLFSDGSEIKKLTDKTTDAAITIIFMLSGARISEIQGLKLSDFVKYNEVYDIDENDKLAHNAQWQFNSYIHKTNFGIGTMRYIGGLAGQTVEALKTLGHIRRDKEDVYLFYTYAASAKNMPSDGAIRVALRSCYKDFLDTLPEALKIQFLEDCPTIKPHSFRHTFAEFALRRFDGNVAEKIRHHFRHHFGSYFTKTYIEYKLSDDESREAERDYIRELMLRIYEGDEVFTGPMALRLKKHIDDNFDFIGLDEVEDIEKHINEMLDDVDRVVAHEWGLCVLMKSTTNQAQCFDKRTKLPQLEVGSSFSTCSHCIHRLTLGNNRENIERQGISTQQFLNDIPVIAKSIKKSYEQSLKNAEQMLKEIEKEEENFNGV